MTPKQKIETNTLIRYDDLSLDMKRYEVKRDGKEIVLRDKEIKILEHLLRHPEQVMTREMIISYVWGPTAEKFTNVVDVTFIT